jgi:hypothetical protein
MTQRCKQFLETVYLVGSITERSVYRSGTGAKGNGKFERKLSWEVMELFLGDCVPLSADVHCYLKRKLEPGAIASLEKELKTKLDRSTLEKESRINWDNDAANGLFNGAHHIYNRINLVKSREQKVVGNNVPNNIKDVLDKVMDYAPSGIVPDMNNHTFDYNEPEVDDSVDNEQDIVDGFPQSQKPCLVDLLLVGLDGKSARNSAEFRDYSDSGPFELCNHHWNFFSDCKMYSCQFRPRSRWF